MTESCFIERLERLTSLSNAEKRAISRIEGPERVYRRSAMIRPQRDSECEAYVINSGWLVSFILLRDGTRQILRIHLPGDLVGLSCITFREAPESLMATTDARVVPVERGALVRLMAEHPRLGTLLFMMAQVEQANMSDRLASLGRTSARARIAALVIDTINRLRRINDAIGRSFVFPLTQEEIGDATGLTAVHVNRMIRSLVAEGLIHRKANLLTIANEARLTELANYVDRYAEIDLGALPHSA